MESGPASALASLCPPNQELIRRPQACHDPILRYAGLFNDLGDRRALLEEPQQLQREWLGAG
jgi:hypothetical protein